MTLAHPNRTITDIRARLRLGGAFATDAIKDVVEVWKAQECRLGRTAEALGISDSTLERLRDAFPDLSTALNDAKAARDILGP